jgi:hypothetical protein
MRVTAQPFWAAGRVSKANAGVAAQLVDQALADDCHGFSPESFPPVDEQVERINGRKPEDETGRSNRQRAEFQRLRHHFKADRGEQNAAGITKR